MLNKSSVFFPEYFTPHLGEYVNVLSALEKLNVAILKAMDKTKEVGDDGFHCVKFGIAFTLQRSTSSLLFVLELSEHL